MMNPGLLLDNNQIGTMPADSSFAKLRAMRAKTVGMLWTSGTHHTQAVYERCERELGEPTYIIRVGGHAQTAGEWTRDARDALAEVPGLAILQNRVILVCGNEPSIEGWSGNARGYGQLYRDAAVASVPVAFACPSLGLDNWEDWLDEALAEVGYQPSHGIVNLYGGNVGRVNEFMSRFGNLYIGEVNSLPQFSGGLRVAFLREAFGVFERAGVKAALIFIAGGHGGGAWDERYTLSESEAQQLGENIPGIIPVKNDSENDTEGAMDEATQTALIEMEARQNALLTQALVAFREGRFEGADGIDGIIVALNGGKLPDNYKPVYPPLS